MKTLCCSVRLESLTKISDKAYIAVAFDGSSDIIPASQVFGRDYDVENSEAWWISSWILEKKKLQFSNRKKAWFDENRNMLPSYTVERHSPETMEPVTDNIVESLRK